MHIKHIHSYIYVTRVHDLYPVIEGDTLVFSYRIKERPACMHGNRGLLGEYICLVVIICVLFYSLFLCVWIFSTVICTKVFFLSLSIPFKLSVRQVRSLFLAIPSGALLAAYVPVRVIHFSCCAFRFCYVFDHKDDN